MKIFKFVFLILFIIFIDYSKLIYSDFKSFISSFASEIYNLNRNPFLNIFFFPFYPFFKESRYGYIMAINLVFMMPVMILLFKLINCGLVNNTSGKIEFNSKAVEILFSISAAFVIFLSPSLWHPSLKAIPDICGMIPVLFAFILYLKYGFDKKIPVKIILLTVFFMF